MSDSAVDAYAEAYDADFTNSPIGRIQRQQVYRQISNLLSPTQNVLELNCGTGEDALYLASKVKYILATDLSAKMTRVLSQKGPPDNLSTQVLDAKDIASIGANRFDLVFSNFGGLNCLSTAELKVFSNQLSSVLKPGACFIAVIMSRHCMWDQWLRRKEKSSLPTRKSGGPVNLRVGESKVDTYYFDPSQFASIFKDNFRTLKVRPIGLFVPPSYMNPAFTNRNLLLSLLTRLDRLTAESSKLAAYADHFLIALQKS